MNKAFIKVSLSSTDEAITNTLALPYDKALNYSYVNQREFKRKADILMTENIEKFTLDKICRNQNAKTKINMF